MSSCVFCLVIAREFCLFQSDCSAITKEHIFFAIELIIVNLFCKQTLKMEETLYKLDIFRHRPISGLFPLRCQSLRQTFQRIIQALLFAQHLHCFCCLVGLSGQNEATLKKKKKKVSFSSLPSIFGYLGKETINIAEHVIMKKIYLRAFVNKEFVHGGLIGLIQGKHAGPFIFFFLFILMLIYIFLILYLLSCS